MYCIYTDTEITKKNSSEEHIIPLSLGGSNAFTIIVDKEFNSKVGSEIDGRLSNDFIINMARSKRGIRGHSNKMVEMIWKQSNLNGDSTQPIQVTFPLDLNENVKIWNPKTRKYLPPEQTSGAKIQSKFILDRLIRVKFASKVALGAGYFVYGDLFRQHIEHSLLREVLAEDIGHWWDIGAGGTLVPGLSLLLFPFHFHPGAVLGIVELGALPLCLWHGQSFDLKYWHKVSRLMPNSRARAAFCSPAAASWRKSTI